MTTQATQVDLDWTTTLSADEFRTMVGQFSLVQNQTLRKALGEKIDKIASDRKASSNGRMKRDGTQMSESELSTWRSRALTAQKCTERQLAALDEVIANQIANGIGLDDLVVIRDFMRLHDDDMTLQEWKILDKLDAFISSALEG